MEEVRAAMEEHINQMADLVENYEAVSSSFPPTSLIGQLQVLHLVQKLSGELRSGVVPAYDNFMAFFHSIDWKEPWLMALLAFHVLLLLTTILSRRHVNFQMCLFLLALSGVYLAGRLNRFLGEQWQRFATQNYFDTHGIFLSVLWSGPLLIIAMLILLIPSSLCVI